MARALLVAAAAGLLAGRTAAFGTTMRGQRLRLSMSTESAEEAVAAAPAYPGASFGKELEIMRLKARISQIAASMDRGTVRYKYADAYTEKAAAMRQELEALIAHPGAPAVPTDLSALDGEWELIYTSVKHGIFRSSPFFLAIEEAYDNEELSNLFFKLHELQTCSWGVSTVGRVAQVWDSEAKMMYSEFDTSLFGLTTIPIVGFFKLLPTFGGCVRTESKVTSTEIGPDGRVEMEVDLTRAKEVPGLPPLPILGDRVYDIEVPVGDIWEKLPWNKGPAKCAVNIVYLDDDFRIAADKYGELFVYTRPVVPRE
eukprot:CAMPEP_0118863502 /NCGR_PEP_ID=MMETSP1163-20130328/8348_1 /TAXON_ID=124430 /ORGANISM="Phaeomonas parva, Strain CCMP2877" /LENGTH=312 /DNA_ID=CAMNT_0006797513 /DNA_START=45 /DNA_END=983 /DNA_ORIENTATION=-